MNQYLQEQTRLYLAKLKGEQLAADDQLSNMRPALRRLRGFNLMAWIARWRQPTPTQRQQRQQRQRL